MGMWIEIRSSYGRPALDHQSWSPNAAVYAYTVQMIAATIAAIVAIILSERPSL